MPKFLVEDLSAEEWAILGEQWRGLVDCPPRGEGWEQPTRGI